MQQANKVPPKAKQFMHESAATSLLNFAIRPKRLPICRKVKSVTHAAGTSVAGLTVNIARSNISFLMDQVDICNGEIERETEFSPGKLIEHLEIANMVHFVLCFTSVKRDTFSTGSQNVATRAFAELPKKSMGIYFKGIAKVRSILEREVIDKMTWLAEKISGCPEADWSKHIHSLLKEKVRPALFRMTQTLTDVEKDITNVAERAKEAFDADVDQVWECSL